MLAFLRRYSYSNFVLASQHARKRGYRFWKAFTTGKSPSVGGIPHDLHGMTTRSIHQYQLLATTTPYCLFVGLFLSALDTSWELLPS